MEQLNTYLRYNLRSVVFILLFHLLTSCRPIPFEIYVVYLQVIYKHKHNTSLTAFVHVCLILPRLLLCYYVRSSYSPEVLSKELAYHQDTGYL